jgi:hypothetical protein
MESNKEKF